jgi:tRNA (adenine22-N1)-methyltransferase
MTKRLKIICSEIEQCNIFGDIGCDHGFISEYVLQNNLCNTAVITDISKQSLKKAEDLLKKYFKQKRCVSYCTDGFKAVDEDINQAVIAGMGGMEIISILSEKMPQKLILQPMKNQYDLRKFLMQNYSIKKDYVFSEGKRFYDLIVCEKGNCNLSEKQLIFGLTNLKEKNEDFLNKIKKELDKTINYLKNVENKNTKLQLQERCNILKELLDE